MSDFKKLFRAKRILAMMLAAAMVVTMLPTTANAAAVNPIVTDGTQETNDVSTPETESVTVPEETTSVSTEETDETVPAADGTAAAEETTDADEPEAAEPVADGAEGDTAATAYTIVDKIPAGNKTAVYSGDKAFDATNWDIAEYIEIQKNNQYYVNYYDFYWNGEDSDSVLTNLTLKWQEEKAGVYTDMAADASPVNAGNYKLVIELPKADGDNGHAGAKAEILFTIAKAPLTAEVVLENTKPGSKAQDVKVLALTETAANNGKTFTYSADETSELSYTKKVRNAITGETLTDDTTLVKNGDYVADFTVAFTDKVSAEDKANYELRTTVSKDIIMSDLISTRVEFNFTEKWIDKEAGTEGPISKAYDETAMTEPVKGTDYTAKVVRTDDNTEILNAEMKGIWLDESYNELEAAPTEAGAYYYQLCYEPNDNVYAGASVEIPVEITKAVLTIKPVLKEDAKIYAGMTAAEVLKQADYEVYDAAGTAKKIDRNSFWGTSYYSSTKTQPYEPVFEVQMADGETTDAEGNTTTTYASLNADAALQSGKTYRIIFTGLKGVYNANGTGESTRDINDYNVDSANANYRVDTETAVLEKNTAAITADAGIAATINVDAILQDGTKAGASYENPITKVYDTKRIYEKRAEYKKAVVTASENGQDKTVAKDTDDSITYTWYVQSGTTTETNPETQETKEVPVWSEAVYSNSPSDAGTYKLVVSYKDDKNIYHASAKEVFYQIEKQKVKVVPDGEYTALTGVDIDRFLGLTEFTYEIQTVPSGDEKAATLEWNTKYYTVYWKVEKSTDAENKVWTDAAGEVFEKDASYRLAVDELELHADNLYNNYTNYEIITEGEGDNQTRKEVALNDTKAITVKEMGTIELEVKVDESKLTTKTKVYDGTPIDISKDIANGLIKVVNKADQTEVKDAEIYAGWLDNEEGEAVEAPVNGGSYTYVLIFLGDEKYKAFDDLMVETVSVNITAKEVTVVPAVKEPVVAGTYGYNVFDYTKAAFDGIVDKDAAAFTYQYYYDENLGRYVNSWPAVAWEDFYSKAFSLNLYDAEGNRVYSSNKLKGEKEYTVKLNYCDLKAPYSRNYTLKGSENVKFTTVRGNSTVEKSMYGSSVAEVALNDAVDGMTHTITAKEGIPYCYGALEGNWFAVKIKAPAEYNTIPATALYENSMKAAGGECTQSGNYITAVFDASAKGKKEFDIRWEDGYVEHFVLDFTNAALLDDLREAVAPKSIAFNSPVKKMVVGGTQQLDVKLTKAQESDTIRLIYTVDKEDVLCVSESGYVTALAAGTATVSVAPAHLVDDELKVIDGAKKASVTIKVSEVTAPKIKKVTATDTGIQVLYTKVNDGYRNEFYVLEGKNKTVKDFEDAIDSMRNEKWEGIFAIAPVYSSGYIFDKNTNYIYLSGMKANTDYTVYVRNVSAVRTLSDGCKVTESAAGTVKSFTTTKSQVTSLNIFYQDGKTVYDETEDVYTVKLSEGNTTVSVKGCFIEKAENAAADSYDRVWYNLPLTKEQQVNYVNPKLVYKVGVYSNNYKGTKGYIGYYDGYLYETSLASIDKKGKIKLNGVGEVVVLVYDQNTNYYTTETLEITASADSITGKNVRLQVGQSMSLYDMLIYKEGKKVLTGSYTKAIAADEAMLKAFENNEYFELNGDVVTAVKAGGSLDIPVRDLFVESGTTVRLSSVAMDAVKNLKASVITDQYFDLEFTHSGYADGFRITVTDARGSLMRSAYVRKTDVYNAETGKYVYRMNGLTKKSKYNVVVTALYREETSKETKKSFTTTLLPASYVSLKAKETGGVAVYVQYADRSTGLITNANFVSGNTYTLNTGGTELNAGAKYATTDTLTWTSSNSKVATVKANAGSFTATLKAVKTGSTTIEVKSKLTKAVIARYNIWVNAVGDAYDYYGDNEALEKKTIGSSVSSIAALMVGQGVNVVTSEGSYKWLAFTASESRTYRFYSTGDSDSKVWLFYNTSIGNQATTSELNSAAAAYNDDGDEDLNFSLSYYISAGQTVYIAVGGYSLEAINSTVYVE